MKMKHMKKLTGVLLALVMAAVLTAAAFAANVTVPSTGIIAGHTFTAFQIFSGRQENGVLSDVNWGDGIDSAAFLAALKTDADYSSLFISCTTAETVAVVLSENNTNTALANRFAKLAEDHKTGLGTVLVAGENALADGYYLIVDTTEDVGAGGAYNTALLQVVGDINITAKTSAPSVEKKVLEDDKYNENGGYGTGYNDVADYNMGEAVCFRLIGLVPDMSRYDTYKYTFNDTLSAGLTPPAEANVKVYLSADKTRDDSPTDTEITTDFNVGVAGQVITVSSDNIKGITGITENMYIIVEYSAILNQNAVVGLDGNPNTVTLTYSNRPDQSGSGDTNNTGTTPEDEVIVFTYELDTTKIDGQDSTAKLSDAQFVLLNADATKVAKITSGKFDGWQDIPAAVNGVIPWPSTSILTSAETTGLFSVTGLDDGTYKLREIVAPAGYNLLTQDVEVIITATANNGQDWTDGIASNALTALTVTANGVTGTGNTTTGIAAITIANNAGTTLPETGGIGTTIFYIIGSILFVGAAVVLVTKKRTGHVER